MLSDEWLPRYRLLENFTAKWNGNGNAYDRGDYNSSFALRAVELKTNMFIRFSAKAYTKFHVHYVIRYMTPKMFTDCIDASFSQTSKAQILLYATLEF